MYGIYTRHTARPGERDGLIQTMLSAAAFLGDVPDCVQFIVNKAEEPDGIWVSTVWTSRDAHDATLQRDDVRAAISDATRFLSDTPPQQIFLTPVGGKGLPKG